MNGPSKGLGHEDGPRSPDFRVAGIRIRDLKMKEPIHVIVEYNPSQQYGSGAQDTIGAFRETADQREFAYWPKFSKSGNLGMNTESIPVINESIEHFRSSGKQDIHFYMYGPDHGKDRPAELFVARLLRVLSEDQVTLADEHVPDYCRKINLPVKFWFKICSILEVKRSTAALDNLVIYPDMMFLDRVSFLSPRMVLEATPQIFF
jgi:hypothetical protein